MKLMLNQALQELLQNENIDMESNIEISNNILNFDINDLQESEYYGYSIRVDKVFLWKKLNIFWYYNISIMIWSYLLWRINSDKFICTIQYDDWIDLWDDYFWFFIKIFSVKWYNNYFWKKWIFAVDIPYAVIKL